MFEIEVEREGVDYQAGDCTLLIRPDQVDSRPYSFSSHPDEPVLRFLVRKIEGTGSEQAFSPWLSSLGPGDEVGVGTPFGWFHPGSHDQEVWFATGTGVSPFLAALRAKNPIRPLAFCVGVRSPQDAVLPDWIGSRVPARWAYSRFSHSGQPPQRVTEFAQDVPISPEIGYFLCGNQRMIKAVAQILRDRGVAPSQIHEELFFQ